MLFPVRDVNFFQDSSLTIPVMILLIGKYNLWNKAQSQNVDNIICLEVIKISIKMSLSQGNGPICLNMISFISLSQPSL